jgi:hypothetical protein
MLRLTDAELEVVFNAARPLHPRDRDRFLQAIASELAKLPTLGDGVVHHVCTEIQRRYFSPPLAMN